MATRTPKTTLSQPISSLRRSIFAIATSACPIHDSKSNGLRSPAAAETCPRVFARNGLVAAVGWSALFGFTGPHGNAVICTSPP